MRYWDVEDWMLFCVAGPILGLWQAGDWAGEQLGDGAAFLTLLLLTIPMMWVLFFWVPIMSGAGIVALLLWSCYDVIRSIVNKRRN